MYARLELDCNPKFVDCLLIQHDDNVRRIGKK